MREKLPEGFQRSEFLLEHGAIDMIIPRAELRPRVASVLRQLMNMPTIPMVAVDAVIVDEAAKVAATSDSAARV